MIDLKNMRALLTLLFLTFFFDVSGQATQIVNVETITINGKVKLFTSKTRLLKNFGAADSLVQDFPGCGTYTDETEKGTKFYNYTKSGIKYFLYNKKADFEEIDFKANAENFVMFGNYKISYKTTIEDLSKMFPIAFKNFKKEKEAWLLRLKFNADWDDELQIAIKNGKVFAVYYWTPC